MLGRGIGIKEMKIYDIIEKTAIDVVLDANEVLETKEILERVQVSLGDITRTKLFSRLNNLRGEGIIKGKRVGPGKGAWVWWSTSLFSQNQIVSEDKMLEDQLINESEDVKNEN